MAVFNSNLNTLQIFINNFKNFSNYLILNGIKEWNGIKCHSAIQLFSFALDSFFFFAGIFLSFGFVTILGLCVGFSGIITTGRYGRCLIIVIDRVTRFKGLTLTCYIALSGHNAAHANICQKFDIIAEFLAQSHGIFVRGRHCELKMR